MLPGSPILSQDKRRLPVSGRPWFSYHSLHDQRAKLSGYSFPTLMPMELVTATPNRRLRNAFIQLTGTDPGGDCSDSYPQNYSQIRGKPIP
jgi:hypothetical protein